MSEVARPRILLVTRNLPPMVGGMERLNWHMADELSKVADVHAIAPEGCAALAPKGITLREVPLRPLWKFLLYARALAQREACEWAPDVVLAGSGLTAPIARAAARCCGAKTCVYVHGLDVAVRHPIYRAVWMRAIRSMDRVIANSRVTAELCRCIGVPSSHVAIVHPGVDLPEERQLSREDGQEGVVAEGVMAFRTQHGLGNRPLLLSVGRLSTRKGLREFVGQALPRIVAAQPDVMLLIVGDVPLQALHAVAQSRESIQTAADAAGVGAHVRFLGVIGDYTELGNVFQAAQLHVFPVRDIPGDPEGFGMVAVEAAAHGLPTVAFATGGVVDAVAEGSSGRLVAPGDYPAFADTVVRVLTDTRAWGPTCVAFARQFAWSAFGRQVFEQLVKARRPVDTGRRRA